MMALLRLLSIPSTTTEQMSPTPSLHKPPSLSISTFSFSPLSHILPIKAKRISLFVFQRQPPPPSSSSSAVTIEIPELVSDAEEVSRTRLIAQNVPWSCTFDDIRALFEKHGTVIDVELSMHSKTRNRGLAFITMGSPEEALAALTNLESYELEGRVLKVNYARVRKNTPSSSVQPKPMPIHNLFVANLSFTARAKDLREFFDSGSGNTVTAEVIFHDNPRRSSGYGFVSFSSKVEAEAALTAFQGKIFMGRPIRVARSKRFLRNETKVSLQSEDISTELNLDAEQSDKADEV